MSLKALVFQVVISDEYFVTLDELSAPAVQPSIESKSPFPIEPSEKLAFTTNKSAPPFVNPCKLNVASVGATVIPLVSNSIKYLLTVYELPLKPDNAVYRTADTYLELEPLKVPDDASLAVAWLGDVADAI
jgi:hypothetical protein